MRTWPLPQLEGHQLMLVDLNSGSGFVYGAPPAACDVGVRINALVDAALKAAHGAQPPRDYLGGSRIGEPCARRLAFEVTLTPVDDGKQFEGRLLRIFDAGHQFEDLAIRWLRVAGFDLRTRGHDGRQFGFSVAGGRMRGTSTASSSAALLSASHGLRCLRTPSHVTRPRGHNTPPLLCTTTASAARRRIVPAGSTPRSRAPSGARDP